MKYVTLSLLIIYSLTAYRQESDTKVFNLDKDALRNSICNFEILDDFIIHDVSHAYFVDLNEYSRRVSLSIFDMSENPFHLNVLDSLGLVDSCYRRLISYGQKYKSQELFSIGDKWTYETRNHPFGLIGFKEYTIIDTTQWHGETAFVVEPGLYSNFDYMLVKDNKVYFWDEELSDYQLNYDFDNDSSYYIKYMSFITNQIDSTIVLIDSISIENINGVAHSVQHCRSALGRGDGDIKEPFKVYNKIGLDSLGPRLEIRTISSNITEDVQRIRCFENSTQHFTFTELACDSTWIITHTNDISKDPIKIYPNPTHQGVWVDGVDGEINFEIYDQSGILLKKGIARESFITLNKTGSYIIRVKIKDAWISKRVIRME